MRNGLRIGVGVLLSIWYLLTVVAQYPDDNYGKLRRLRFINGSFLIPNWKFFAPNPGTEDFVLLYRQFMSDDKDWGSWEYVIKPRPPRIWHPLFSPTSRQDKGILDIVTTLQSMSGIEALDAQVQACRSLLQNTIIRTTPKDGTVQQIQVMIARGKGFDPDGKPAYDYVFEPVEIQKGKH